jgi:hypothetical protein
VKKGNPWSVYLNVVQQKIEQSTDVLKAIISPMMHERDVQWPPRDPDTVKSMEKVKTHLPNFFCIHLVCLGLYLHFAMVFVIAITNKMNCEHVIVSTKIQTSLQ